ncbi:ABC transporter substrate-binding protein, partial [uncultured Nisaea sp.]|uniref:ABC transporter substrate-binding protein n=1 Tax=uncultured Nisaea sp. TaxID=538215 RepID=UPI0030EE9045
ELIYIAHKDRLDDPRLKKFLAAVERATQYLVNHPDDAWASFIDGRKELDDELNKRAWRDTLPRFALRPAALDRGRYERFAAFMKESGLVNKDVKTELYATELQ